MSVTGMLSKIKIDRPLANAHWSLLLILLAAFEALLIFGQCTPIIPAAFYYLSFFTIMVLAWATHLRYSPINKLNIFVSYLVKFFVDLFLFMILLISISMVVVIITPHYDCYTVRARVSEGILAASTERTTISEAYANTGSMPASYNSKQKSLYVSLVKWLKYDQDTGVLIVTLSSDKQLKEAADNTIVLEAKGDISSRVVKFTCKQGSVPAHYLPSSCREK